MDAHANHAASTILFALLVVLPLAVLVAYLSTAWRERVTGHWHAWRAMSFTVGVSLLVVAMIPPVSTWAHQDLRGHMLQHLLLGMFAPLFLVLGAPGTLLLRSLPVAVAKRIVAVLGWLPVRCLIHPVTAALLDIGALYVLYLTPLFELSLREPVVHVLVHLHFVIAGYLFTWAIAGPDPAPKRPGMTLRLGVLLLATAAHANLGKIMYGYGYPAGTMADSSEIQAAAQWMYYGGDLAELLLIIAFFAAWFGRWRSSPGIKLGITPEPVFGQCGFRLKASHRPSQGER